VLKGLCDAIGVSNFNEGRVRSAASRLGAQGIPLASNQVGQLQQLVLSREAEE